MRGSFLFMAAYLEGKKGIYQKLVKPSTLAMALEYLVVLFLKPLIEEVGALLVLVQRPVSIENRLPPVDRIALLQASLACNNYADC